MNVANPAVLGNDAYLYVEPWFFAQRFLNLDRQLLAIGRMNPFEPVCCGDDGSGAKRQLEYPLHVVV